MKINKTASLSINSFTTIHLPNISDNPYRYNTQIPKTPSIVGILSLIIRYMSQMKKDPISHTEDIRTGIYSD